MELKTYFAQDLAGNVIPDAIITLYVNGTETLATGLQTVGGTTLSNPFSADVNGKIQFKAPDGLYDMQIKYGDQTGPKVTIQCLDLTSAVMTATQQADRAQQMRDETQAIINGAGEQSTLVVLAQPDGAKNIGRCPDIATLKTIEPTVSGQKIEVVAYYSGWAAYVDGPVGGGEFYYDAADTTSVDNGGTVIVTTGGKRWKRKVADSSTFYAVWFGVHYSVNDNAPLLKKAADAARKRILQLPSSPNPRPLVIKTPVIFQTNCGVKLRGCGPKDATVISVQIPETYSDYGALHFPGKNQTTNVTEPGYAGIEISDIQLLGNLSKCHGVYLQYQFSSLYRNVIVESFDGAGLLIDKSQDSVFDKFDVWNCGRTSGDRNLLIDTFDMSKTIFGPIHLVSTLPRTKPNNLRFNNCQWEDNKVTPVFNGLQAGISIVINDPHIEYDSGWDTTGTNGGTAIRLSEGIVDVVGGEISNYSHIYQSYAELYMTDVRCSPGIYHDTAAATSGRWVFRNINMRGIGSLNTTSFKVYDTCRFYEDIDLTSPNFITRFTNCEFYGAVSGSTTSSGNKGVFFDDCYFDSTMNFPTGISNVMVFGGTVTGPTTFGSAAGVFSPARRVSSSLTTGVNVQFVRDMNKQLLGTAAPTSGIYSIGDRLINTAPAAGGYTGWVCVAAGSPGTWKGYGLIQA